MKTISQFVYTIMILAALSSNLLAGDYAALKFIGFSRDGKYLAFEESGEWDGSGGEYATTYYVDTAKNSFASKPTVFEWEDGAPGYKRLLSRYKTRVPPQLRKFGIVGGNTGEMVVAHLLNDMSFVTPVGEREQYFYEEGSKEAVYKKVPDYTGAFLRRDGGTIEKVIFNPAIDPYNQNTHEFYELTLIPTPAKETEGCSEGYKIEVTLKDNTQHYATDLRILQKDGDVLPQGRQCPYGYRVERVYIYKNRIAVFLNVFGQGFEGPDMRYMVVTGELEAGQAG